MLPVLIFEGPDRSGKTTIADLVAKYYNTEVFMTNSRECFADLNNDSTNLAKFNYHIAKFIETIGVGNRMIKPVIVYRSFLSEKVYADLFKRQTDDYYNFYTDLTFETMGATIFLLKNAKEKQYNDETLSDDKIRESIKLFDRHKRQTRTQIIEIDTYKRDVDSYVSQVVKFVEAKYKVIS